MVDVIGRAKVIVSGDVDSGSIDRAGGKIGTALKAGAAVGVAALGALAVQGVKAVQAFEEAESVSRVLNNTLGNMGKSGAAEAVDKLADSLMRKTGVDDEVIKKGQTILATFSEVAASAGEMGGTFERASALSLDLAATGFGSVDAGAKALGKALQDPSKGIAALGRAGVTFTEEQKELIKGFVETGETAKAQGVILAEVERQVGGNAEAAATASDKLKTAIGEAQETLGGLIADLFDTGKDKSLMELATDATYKFNDAVKKFQNSKDWKTLKTDFHTFTGDAKTLAGYLSKIVGYMNTLSKAGTGAGLLHWMKEATDMFNPLSKIVTMLERAEAAWRFLKGIGDDVPDAPDQSQPLSTRASGGPASGLTLVGEKGPEIVSLPSGSYVHSNEDSQKMVGGSTQNYYITGPVSLAELRQRAAWYDTYGTRFG